MSDDSLQLNVMQIVQFLKNCFPGATSTFPGTCSGWRCPSCSSPALSAGPSWATCSGSTLIRWAWLKTYRWAVGTSKSIFCFRKNVFEVFLCLLSFIFSFLFDQVASSSRIYWAPHHFLKNKKMRCSKPREDTFSQKYLS